MLVCSNLVPVWCPPANGAACGRCVLPGTQNEAVKNTSHIKGYRHLGIPGFTPAQSLQKPANLGGSLGGYDRQLVPNFGEVMV